VRQVGDVVAREGHREGLAAQSLAAQAPHSLLTMNCSARFFIWALCELAKVCSTCRLALENVPM
jgi:hypothetical protein